MIHRMFPLARGGAPVDRIDRMLRPWAFLTVLRERRRAGRVCRELLRLYREVVSGHPDLNRTELYVEVLARRMDGDTGRARATVARADDSFAAWPTERDLTFRDVAHYVAAFECLAAEPGAGGIRAHLASVVAATIPDDL